MKIAFSKMHGIGNDFVVIDDRSGDIAKTMSYNDLSINLCHRNFGIGADGLIVVLNSETHDLKYRIFNPDGTEPQMCGNGMRVYAKYVYDNKIITKEEFRVETLAGTIIPRVNIGNDGLVHTVRVDMGIPVTEAARVPFISDNKEAISESISVDDKVFNVTAVSMGNPHGVIFTEKNDRAVVQQFGAKLERHERFPEKANIEFIEVISKEEVNMLVWERGAGETLACGTGACASIVAGYLNGKTSNKAAVHLLGGDLFIEWDLDSKHIYKTGPAKLVFTGEVVI